MWNVTVDIKKKAGSQADPASDITVLTDTQEFDLTEEVAITRDFSLKPAVTGTGSINLTLTLDSGVSADSVTASGLSDTVVTLTKSASDFILANDSVSSGRYTVTFNFKKTDGTLDYYLTQEINVFPGMETNRWITGGESNSVLTITSAMVEPFLRKVLYVGAAAAGIEPNDTTGRGSLYKPYALSQRRWK